MDNKNFELATLGTGCFWCTEAVFDTLMGVDSVFPGYSGGHVVNPTYEQICEKTTGHAEVVQIKFDPTVISFEDLLEVFWRTHNPTTPNRQGNDVGPQYRSVIFYHDENQKEMAEAVVKKVADFYDKPIVTEISPLDVFYKAEDNHQDYYRNNKEQGYCSFVITPKLSKLRKLYGDRLK